jgi:DNA-binding transcriptional ArsR family regulator
MADQSAPAGGWVPAENPDPVVLSSPAQFKALGHPARHRLVNVLRQRPATLRQLATALGLAKGTVSYHLRVLREAGLVSLVGTRHVRGGTEEHFALVSGDFRHDDAAGGEFLVRAALAEMCPPRPGQPEQTVLRHLWLTPAEAATLATWLAEHGAGLGEECAGLAERAAKPAPEDGSATEPYGLLLSLYPADIPALPADEAG